MQMIEKRQTECISKSVRVRQGGERDKERAEEKKKSKGGSGGRSW